MDVKTQNPKCHCSMCRRTSHELKKHPPGTIGYLPRREFWPDDHVEESK